LAAVARSRGEVLLPVLLLVQDLQEMLGNLLDNACKWALHRVEVNAHIDGAMTRLQAVMIGDDRRAIDAAMQALGAATDEFAARRMNQSVQRALSGKNIAELT
jgi:hypothetical protein